MKHSESDLYARQPGIAAPQGAGEVERVVAAMKTQFERLLLLSKRLSAEARSGETDSVLQLLEERAAILTEVVVLRERMSASQSGIGWEEIFAKRCASLLKEIQQEGEEIATLLAVRKEQMFARLKEAHQQKALHSYIHREGRT